MVGFVIVSHSETLANGVVELTKMMADGVLPSVPPAVWTAAASARAMKKFRTPLTKFTQTTA
ncbi:MAG: hypothetical protein ACLS3C_02275 [Oscillospiraceae bacterium]